MTKHLPPTRDGLLAYPRFALLESAVQNKFLELLAAGCLNDKGGLKRPSNGFIHFRNQFAATHLGSTSSDPMKQSTLSTLTKMNWDNLPAAEKAKYDALYQADKQALQRLFPEYKYKPIQLSIWNSLKSEGQKQFWFDSVAQICYKMVHQDSVWEGALTVETWLQRPGNKDPAYIDILKYNEASVALKAPRASKNPKANTQPATSAVEPIRAGHPYASTRLTRNAAPQASDHGRDETHMRMLKGMLWPLGTQYPGGPARRLVLAFVQPQDLLKRVYVEEEIPRGIPGEIVNELLAGQESIAEASDVIILRDFTNPPCQTETQESSPISTTPTESIGRYPVIAATPTASTPSGTHSPSPENISSSESLSPDTPTGNVHVGLAASTAPSKPASPAHEEHSYDNSLQISSTPTASTLGYFVESTDIQTARNQAPSVPLPTSASAQPQPTHLATGNETGLTILTTHTLDARALAPASQNLPVAEVHSFAALDKNTASAGRDQVPFYGAELLAQGGIWDGGSWLSANTNHGQTQGQLSHNQENMAYELGSTTSQLSQVFSETAGASRSRIEGFGEFGVSVPVDDSFYHQHGYFGLAGGY